MKRKRIPEAFHPGEYLKDELEARNMTREDLAKKVEVLPWVVEDIISNQCPISLEMAKRIGEVLGTGAEVWENLQTVYDLTKEIRSARKKK